MRNIKNVLFILVLLLTLTGFSTPMTTNQKKKIERRLETSGYLNRVG